MTGFLFRFRQYFGYELLDEHPYRLPSNNTFSQWGSYVCRFLISPACESWCRRCVLNFALSFQPFDNCMNRGKQIPILSSVEALGFQSKPHLLCSYSLISGAYECQSNGIGQPETFFNIDIFFAAQLGKYGDGLTKVCNALFQFQCFVLSFAKFSDGLCKLLFCFCECSSVMLVQWGSCRYVAHQKDDIYV
jgi:hypothetical protein